MPAAVAIDLALAFGVLGTVLGAASLGYSRVQAVAAKRSAEAASTLTLAQLKEELAGRRRAVGHAIFANPAFRAEWLAANPHYAPILEKVGGIEGLLSLREFFAAAQVSYQLRKEGVLDDADWAMTAGVSPTMFPTPSFRAYFDVSLRAGNFDPGFLDAFRPCLEGRPPVDPKPKRR
jgi:hypothetical protein